MTNAKRDDNRVTSALGVSSADGVTPTPFQVNPVTNRLTVTISDESVTATVGSDPVSRDQNRVAVACGVSSSDETTIIPLHCTTGGKLLMEF